MINTYLQYGISLQLATKLESLNLPKTTFEKTSKKNLIDIYKLTRDEVDLVMDLIKRVPISEIVIQALLENSNYTCCICQGIKSDSYIIHHIEQYSVSQDNSYQNLAVLCLNDHDLAHKEGRSLTLKLTADQIRISKKKWEQQVIENKVHKASISGDIQEVEFLNIPRILEVSTELFNEIPKTKYTESLIHECLINGDGHVNHQRISQLASNPHTPFLFFGPHGSTKLRFHYFDIFKKILSAIDFKDLDTFLNKKSIKEGIIGEYCFFVGGLYGKKLPENISSNSEMVKFYFKKKSYVVEWLVDPRYFASSSAQHRAYQRNTYIIYGKILNVNISEDGEPKRIVLDVRPYCFGLPKERKHRKPDIAYQKECEEMLDDDEE